MGLTVEAKIGGKNFEIDWIGSKLGVFKYVARPLFSHCLQALTYLPSICIGQDFYSFFSDNALDTCIIFSMKHANVIRKSRCVDKSF